MDPMSQEDVPVRGRMASALLLIFCCWHAVFLIFSIKPPPPARDDPGNPAVDLYRIALGGRQLWFMFETIPVLHSLDVRLEGEDAMGRKVTTGCVLPGFKPYPRPEDSRYYVLMFRLMFFDNKTAFRDAYLRKVAQLLAAARGPAAGKNWSLVVDTVFTRILSESRRDGQVSMPVTNTFPIPDNGSR
jgi:hypothetical protein